MLSKRILVISGLAFLTIAIVSALDLVRPVLRRTGIVEHSRVAHGHDAERLSTGDVGAAEVPDVG